MPLVWSFWRDSRWVFEGLVPIRPLARFWLTDAPPIGYTSGLPRGQMFKVLHNRIITVWYTITDETGRRVDQQLSDAPLVYLHGRQALLGNVQDQLEGHFAGHQIRLTLSPDEGFVSVTSEPLRADPISAVASAPGCAVLASIGDQDTTLWIRRATDAELELSADDPLVGRTLTIEVGVLDVRRATAAELAAGHPLEREEDH